MTKQHKINAAQELQIGIISLGCDKNRVDTERMLYNLGKGGFKLTNDFSLADAIIINTCAFIEAARAEAIDTILQAAQFKKTGRLKKLIVTGCLPQKYADEIKNDLPEVDAFLGVASYEKIESVITELFTGQTQKAAEISLSDFFDETGRIQSTPNHYAYLKIADGCDNHCTYCTIPSIRGKYRSRSFDSLIRESEGLAKNGVKELILVAQDTTRYGEDLSGKYMLVPLIKELSRLPFYKIRLMYCYPELVTDELISEIANNDKLAKYIDIPFQHIDDGILKLMNRKVTSDKIKTLIKKLRNQKEYIAIRTSLISGFPTESEAAHERLKEFLEEYKLDNAGIFSYSKEDGTAAARLKGQIRIAEKNRRVNELRLVQERVKAQINKKYIGKTLKVLYEDIDYDRSAFIGRTQYDAPLVDSAVYFKGAFADAGGIYDVKITGSDGIDLIGEIVNNEFAD